MIHKFVDHSMLLMVIEVIQRLRMVTRVIPTAVKTTLWTLESWLATYQLVSAWNIPMVIARRLLQQVVDVALPCLTGGSMQAVRPST